MLAKKHPPQHKQKSVADDMQLKLQELRSAIKSALILFKLRGMQF